MMTCEKGLQKHITFAHDEHVQKILDDKAKKKEEELITRADIGYLDYTKISYLVRGFYSTSVKSEKLYYKARLLEIYNTYGKWLDDYTIKQIKPVLRTIIGG